jgi:hypothetical protein
MDNMNNTRPIQPLVAALVIVVAMLVGVWGIPYALDLRKSPELVLGLVVILGVTVLGVLFFILTTGYAALGLADRKQALGMPEGSVRAMIALFLLITFVIVSLYVFGRVSIKYPDTQITDEAPKLAGQMITLLGTLVGTISGFYFGTSALAAAKEIGERRSPVIRSLSPTDAKQGTNVNLNVKGSNFQNPRSVRLKRGNDEMTGSNIMSKSDEIQCTVQVNQQPGGKWDLLVMNENGQEDQLPAAFTITP